MRLNRLNQLVRGRDTLDGTWRLDEGHEVTYRYKRSGRQEEILLAGQLVAVNSRSLTIRVTQDSLNEDVVGRLLHLGGRWQADAQNRLSFLVERKNGRHDLLTLQGAWEMDSGHELLYRYDRFELKTKKRETHTLRFQGYWDLSEANRLTYVLDAASNSMFRFRGAFQSPSLLVRHGVIRYQVGVELQGRRSLQTVSLFGKWKISRDLTLEFEMDSANGTRSILRFGAAYAVNSRATLSARLTNREGEPLGCELLLTKEIFREDGQVFVRLRKSLEERAVEGGIRFRW